MGGKQKVANRTKGNVKPSSSARAAQMLEGSTNGFSGFVGFGGFSTSSGDPGYVPAANVGGDECDNSVDADFRMSMRKLSKKDATTKLKALQEICTLCKEKDEAAMLSIMPFWPRLYNKVSVDSDRRVRETLHEVMELLVKKVGKNLAPHLKPLMGCWLVSQCDTYPSVASAAKSAFSAGFPSTKQVKVVEFCKEEILAHIEDNLIYQTAQTLSDPKNTAPEDVESKYHKVMTENLLALRLFITLIPEDQLDSIKDRVHSIVSHKKFWKLFSHDFNLIRAAYYRLISTLCQIFPTIVKDLSSKICPSVLYKFDETDPIVCPVLWEAALYVLNYIDSCWEDVNPRKGVLPKIWTMMKAGGSGSAVSIYPNLLPLLAKIPHSVIGNGIAFYQEFFTNMKVSFTDEKVLKIPSEVSAIVKAYIECIKYCLVQNFSQNERKNLTDFLLCDHMLPLLEASFIDTNPVLANSPLYEQVIEFLKYLQITSDESDKEKSVGAIYLSELFWNSFSQICVSHVEGGNQFTVARVGMFLQQIKKPKRPKVPKVKFDTDEDVDIDIDSGEENALVSTSDLPALKLVFTICHTCLTKITEKQSQEHLHVLAILSELYISHDLCLYLSGSDSAEDPPTYFLKNRIFPLAEIAKSRAEYVHVSQIIISVLNMVESENKVRVVEEVLMVPNVQPGFLWPLFRNIYRLVKDPNMIAWFRGDIFGDHILGVARDLCSGGSHNTESVGWNYVKFSLSPENIDESLLGPKHVQSLFQFISQILPVDYNIMSPNVVNAIMYVCDIISQFCSVEQLRVDGAVEDLILSLFKIECICQADVRLLSMVNNAWYRLMIKLLSQTAMNMKIGTLLEEMAISLKHEVLQQNNTVDKLDKLCQLGKGVCKCLQESSPNEEDKSFIDAFIGWLGLSFGMATLPQWEGSVIVNGTLLYVRPFELKPHPVDVLPKCISSVYFSTNVLSFAYKGILPEDNEIGGLRDLSICLALCNAILGRRKKSLLPCELQKLSQRLEENFTLQINSAAESTKKKLVENMFQTSLSEGGLSALGLGCTLNKLDTVLKEKLGVLRLNFEPDRFDILIEPVLHTLLVSLPHMSKYDLAEIAQIQATKFISCSADNVLDVTGGLGSLAVYNRCMALQHVFLETQTSSNLNVDVTIEILSQLQKLRDEDDSLFAFDCGITSLDLPVIYFNVEVIKCLQTIIEKIPSKILQSQWDFILCSTVTWVQTIQNSLFPSSFAHLPTLTFTIATCDLLSEVVVCITELIPRDPDNFPSNITTEWEEFFSEGAYNLLVPLFFSLIKSKFGDDAATSSLVKSFCRALSYCPKSNLFKNSLPSKLIAGDDTCLPVAVQTFLNHFCPLLAHENRSVQVAVFRVLSSIIRDLPEYDKDNNTQNEIKEEDCRSPPTALMAVLESSRHGLEMLFHHEDNLSVCVDPGVEEYTHIYAYLFSWNLLLDFFKAAPSELRAEYSTYLRDLSALDNLMINLFRLMPHNPTLQLEDALICEPASGKLTSRKSMFAEKPTLCVFDEASCAELQHLACAVYHKALQDLPAILRQWFNTLSKANASVVDKFTSSYVSPILCSEELIALQNNDVKMDNMTIKVRMQSREVVAIYQLEEVSMELSITLAPNHPLGTITVESLKRIGVANAQWRNWMLQLTTFLSHQNGSILDGLSLWKRNVDKRFEGLEECMICFAVMHGSTCQLPKLQCKTCKKKYHSACLYKWFNSSNNSTCPLCRNLF